MFLSCSKTNKGFYGENAEVTWLLVDWLPCDLFPYLDQGS